MRRTEEVKTKRLERRKRDGVDGGSCKKKELGNIAFRPLTYLKRKLEQSKNWVEIIVATIKIE